MKALQKAASFANIYLRPDSVNYLILYVTSRCNLKCDFCFYADSLNAPWGDGLSLEQLEKISRSLPHCVHVTMTGGEPFLRRDLPEIVRLFCKNSGTVNVTFPTNGSFPDRCEAALRRILPENPQCVFRVALSIDALGDVHDRIRGQTGAFKLAEETFHRLKRLQEEHDNLVLVINSVASKYNKDELIPFIDYAVEHLWCDDHSILLARGRTKEEDARDISPGEYCRIVDYFEEKKRSKRQADSLYKQLLKHVETRTREVVRKVYLEDRYLMPCVAGKKLLVLYDSGDLAPCEILDTQDHPPEVRAELGNFVLANVHAFDYDIGRILETDRARKIQKHILDSRCYCTFECAIAASLALDARNLRYLAKPRL